MQRSCEGNEVFQVMKGINIEKAGLDGFSMAFFKGCWDVINMGVFCDFHASSKLENSLNATFFALI
jgi:hypothetical protein